MVTIVELKQDPDLGSKILLKEFLDKDTTRSLEFIEGARSLFLMMLDGKKTINVSISTDNIKRDAFMYGFFEAIKFYGNLTYGKTNLKLV